MQSELPQSTSASPSPRQKLLRLTTRTWMIVVACTAAVFAAFGMNGAIGMAVAAFFVSALIIRPNYWQGWVVLLTASAAAVPLLLLATLYTIALRAALFVGHWPSYNNPDPKSLPDGFQPQTEFLVIVIPIIVSVVVTCLFVTFVGRCKPRSGQIVLAWLAAIALWILSFLTLGAGAAGILEWLAD